MLQLNDEYLWDYVVDVVRCCWNCALLLMLYVVVDVVCCVYFRSYAPALILGAYAPVII